MASWTYILRCAVGSYYTGHTDDLERRIGEHSAGGYCDYTSRRTPIPLLWASEFPTRHEAPECELKVAKKEALARADWQALSFHARPPAERALRC